MKKIFVSFRAKLFISMVVVVVLSQMATVLAVLKTTHAEVTQRAGETLRFGARVLDQILSARAIQLSSRARILAGDVEFRAAYAEGDLAAMAQIIAPHGAGIGAELVLVADEDGHLLVNSAPALDAHVAAPFARLWQDAQQTGQATALLVLDGEPYQFVLEPVAR